MEQETVHTARGQDALTLTERELFERLGWFTHVRWVLGAFCLVILLVSWHGLGVRFRVGERPVSTAPAVAIVLVLFLYNVVFTLLERAVRVRGLTTRRRIVLMALGQIICDMLAVLGLVHYTGGVENFFLILMLLPLVIATELMPRNLTYATATGAAILINALAWGEQQGLIPHVSIEWSPGNRPARELHADPLYVLEVTTALTVMLYAMVFIASSITARLRRREVELEEAYRRLHAADETKSFFMRKAGHEMRAPLAAIHALLETILNAADALSENHRRLMNRALLRSRALMALVDDLRGYSRLRSGEAAVQHLPVFLSEVVTATVDLFQEQAGRKGLSLSCAAETAAVDGDEELLRELVTNLVTNAIQYTPSGGRIDVSLRAQDGPAPAGGSAILTVADTGIGISEEARRRIFEEFYRAPEARKVFQEGTGLGLAICRRIVEVHGGSIEAAPRPEGGSIFTVHLPLARRSAAHAFPAPADPAEHQS